MNAMTVFNIYRKLESDFLAILEELYVNCM